MPINKGFEGGSEGLNLDPSDRIEQKIDDGKTSGKGGNLTATLLFTEVTDAKDKGKSKY